jgi:hypothetical protein
VYIQQKVISPRRRQCVGLLRARQENDVRHGNSDMKLFISWSGTKSNAIAAKLREWIPLVLYYAEPWMSDRDIHAGGRWSAELATKLQDTSFGIVVLTAANKDSRWVHFEVGALSKAVEEARIMPYLVDFDISALDQPLSQFQAKKASFEATWDIINSINNHSDKKVAEARLRQLFDLAWPDLEKCISEAPTEENEDKVLVTKPTDEILEELVVSVKSLQRGLVNLEDLVRSRIIPDSRALKSDAGYQLDNIELLLDTAEKMASSDAVGEKREIISKADEALQGLKEIYISVDLRDTEKDRARQLVARAKQLQFQ